MKDSGEIFKIDELNRQIREFVNNSVIKKTNIFLEKKSGSWNQFFSALDFIADTSMAINNFMKDDVNFFIYNPYIATYGVLQALFLQQDAVNFLKISLFGEESRLKFWDKKYSELYKIRQLRNETIGHPISTKSEGKNSSYINNEVSACTIDRSTLSKEGFSYTLWFYSKSERRSVNFNKIIKLQEKYLSDELRVIYKELQNEELKHKKLFKGESLLKIINQKSLYDISLVYGLKWGDRLAWPSFDYYHKQYIKVRNGLEKRYGKFSDGLGIQGTKIVIDKLDFIFYKIESFRKLEEIDFNEFDVYLDSLQIHLDELKIHLNEIDNEFKL